MRLDEVRHLLTYDCNLRCRHCYLNGGERRCRGDAQGTEAALRSAFENFYNFFKPPVVSATGGEPLLKKELVLLLAECTARYGGILELVTNGFLLNKELIEALHARNKNTRYQISLDGPPEYHNHLRAHPHAFKTAWEAIELASSYGAVTKVRVTVSDENIDFMPDLIKALDGLGRHNVILVVRPVLQAGRARKNDMRWSYGLDRLMELEGRSRYLKVHTTDVHDPCSCGIRTVAINPAGDVYPCTYFTEDLDFKMGNIADPASLSEHMIFKKYQGRCYAREINRSKRLRVLAA